MESFKLEVEIFKLEVESQSFKLGWKVLRECRTAVVANCVRRGGVTNRGRYSTSTLRHRLVYFRCSRVS